MKKLLSLCVIISCMLLSTDVGSASRVEYTRASFYSMGKITANGSAFNPAGFTAAHPRLPFETFVKVTNLSNNRSVVLMINDRGPFIRGRGIDVTRGAGHHLDMITQGVVRVRVEVLNFRE